MLPAFTLFTNHLMHAVREKPDGEVYVDGACEVLVKTREEVARIIDQGNSKRSTASHK